MPYLLKFNNCKLDKGGVANFGKQKTGQQHGNCSKRTIFHVGLMETGTFPQMRSNVISLVSILIISLR